MPGLRAGLVSRSLVLGLLVPVMVGCVESAPHPPPVQISQDKPVRVAEAAPSPQTPAIPIRDAPIRLSKEKPVRVGEGDASGFEVWLDIVTEPDGTVRSAKGAAEPARLSDRPKDDPRFAPGIAAAESEAVGWRYTPVLRNGQPVAVAFREVIDINPAVHRPERHVPFPEVRSDSRIVITLSRSACYGWCETYGVQINSDGSVAFNGVDNVRSSGQQTGHMSKAGINALAEKFREADFFSLQDKYISPVTDIPIYRICIEIDGKIKNILYDDYSARGGMPDSIVSLGDAVDKAAGTAKWVSGPDAALSSLDIKELKPTSPAGGILLAGAISRRQWDFASALVAAGAPISGAITVITRERCPDMLATAIIRAAVSRGMRRDRTLALTTASRLGDLDLLRRLLARGADPNDRSAVGSPPLFGVYSVAAAKLLVSAGADVKAKDISGWTPLLAADSEDVALYFLEVGVDPSVKDGQGKTIVDRARENGWTRLLAKLGG
jgi:hypothetical protein